MMVGAVHATDGAKYPNWKGAWARWAPTAAYGPLVGGPDGRERKRWLSALSLNEFDSTMLKMEIRDAVAS
jgi:hypothetical protein